MRASVEVVIAVATLGVIIGSWLGFILMAEPDFHAFTIVYGVTVATGTLIHVIMLMYVRSSGSARARLGVGGIFANPSGC